MDMLDIMIPEKIEMQCVFFEVAKLATVTALLVKGDGFRICGCCQTGNENMMSVDHSMLS